MSLRTECASLNLFCLLLFRHFLYFLGLGSQPNLCSLRNIQRGLLAVLSVYALIFLQLLFGRRLLLRFALFPWLRLAPTAGAPGNSRVCVLL